MWYHFRQNNSGGSFCPPAVHVLIEADSAVEANTIAEDHGIYFNGVEDEKDCSCCGDRWYPTSDDGDEKPLIYGMTVQEFLRTDSVGVRFAIADKVHACLLVHKDKAAETL